VAAAVAALPPLQREAVLLFSWEGFSLEEIAEMTNAEAGTIKSRLARARETLRRTLAPYREYVGGTNGTVA
jgi:RNA polymerase sigma-70 factor (ECF subfamily)